MDAVYRIIVIIGFSSAFFIFFPEVDIAITERFFDSTTMTFPYLNHPATLFMYHFIRVVSTFVSLLCLISLLMHYLYRNNTTEENLKNKFSSWNFRLFPTRQHTAFILIALILAPGITVHWGFKEGFGRARPIQTNHFGGDKQYTGAYVISNQGGKSFISGHAAMGFFMVAFALLHNGKKRYQLYTLGIIFGITASLCRVIQGKHYLSDVLFGGLYTLLIIHLLYILFFEPHLVRKEKIKKA